MELFHRIFHILVIFGPAIQLIEAGLLNPMNSVTLFRPLLTTFRGNVNTGYIPNNSLLPFREANSGITYVNPVSPTPIGNGVNSWFYVNKPSITSGVLTQNPWYSGSSPSPVFNVDTDAPNIDSTPDYDAILAQRFPGAVKLLEQLKKLNQIKDEQRKKALAPKIYEENQTTEIPNNTEKIHIFKPELEKHAYETTTDATIVDGRLIMKKLTKKKFYHKAKPVRPENEKIETNEIVYFIDT